MEVFLGKTVDDNADYQELQSLQELLDTKIKIVSPAIDMIDIISARGNTTLESAVTLTKSLRWDIQALGIRLAKAAAAEESSRRKSTKAPSKAIHHAEIRLIVQDIKKLLAKIDHAVPLINLALASSGAKLSTTMPATVSPSRMLQASYMVNTGDFQYSMNPAISAQVGPTFTLSLYMLFAGHSNRVHEGADGMRETTWKEVIHKARVKLMRIPLRTNHVQSAAQILQSIEKDDHVMTGEGRHSEYAYHIEIIEDLDDGRVHSFEDDETQPGLYGDVPLAGIRDFLPIHQISKIFYADTGKILNIGNEGEANSPVLLLKRDINAAPPRRMMQESERDTDLYEDKELEDNKNTDEPAGEESDNDSDDIDAQIRRESSVAVEPVTEPLVDETKWQLPADLDSEWLALEVYTEPEDSDSDTEQDVNDDSAYVSHRPSSSGEDPNPENLSDRLNNLHLSQKSPSPSPAHQISSTPPFNNHFSPAPSPFEPTRSSLSLLEMLIRLTALQQFQQASHLTIPDELLTFFLEESSTTGAGGDGDQRRKTRTEARRKVGFDPYDESPVKRHGEDYQYQGQNWDQGQGQGWESRDRSRGNTPYEDYDGGLPRNNPRWSREQSMPAQRTPEPWLLSRRESSNSRRGTPEIPPSSPVSPYRPQQRKGARHLDRVQSERGVGKNGSPLGRGMSVETDSTLGTSPGSPTLVDKVGKV
ncbi:related to YRB30 Inhibitor of RanGAP1(Rna1p)-mediated GTP hydrolysis [Phialocephala subalpina]|uniref:Related to YRB30 Inhibitor of RanGAP1(Rna1p)-mediated GTP hydrolysis n=1 Tax=Phialocephala subalpina TaxID=576137 RepID=A0A1L7WGH5_9HELO|nr:related to YRB30 Inhibitor of RanGAP1(Rna1p)-mediated GTP hydrolysis [Phialocephala subalpina]